MCYISGEKELRAYGGCLGIKKAMKDVAACDKLRGGGKQPLIRRFPNGITHPTNQRRILSRESVREQTR